MTYESFKSHYLAFFLGLILGLMAANLLSLSDSRVEAAKGRADLAESAYANIVRTCFEESQEDKRIIAYLEKKQEDLKKRYCP